MGACSNRSATLLVCLAGVALSAYALYVEFKMAEDPEYRALCDVDEKISCTKVLNSTYARGFGLVNKVVGECLIFKTVLVSRSHVPKCSTPPTPGDSDSSTSWLVSILFLKLSWC